MPDATNGPTTTGATATAATTANATGAQSALELFNQFESTVSDFKRELKGYGDPNVVGRDTQRLRQYLGQLHSYEMQIAQAMGINWNASVWTPGQT